ncbi:hypothetical protein RRG08_054635 [Elysia crispata]|uniref:Uncharacterized protein n=1 Tax=Elysia crispata TaxID=231223 RepID=A0AAE1E7U9_9GAST|nr:hypothetical protein RRG08_054635 [Elysia crispata]
MCCLRRHLGITWQDRITNAEVLSVAGIPSIIRVLYTDSGTTTLARPYVQNGRIAVDTAKWTTNSALQACLEARLENLHQPWTAHSCDRLSR